MSVEDRRRRIVELARRRGLVRITDLTVELAVSAMTIRRDLAVLADRGVLQRVGGGAVPARGGPVEAPTGAAPVVWPKTDHPTGGAARIGIVVPSGTYYFPLVAAGACAALDHHDVRRMFAVSSRDPDADRRLAGELVSAGCSGLLLTPRLGLEDGDEGRIGWLYELPVPVVLVERTLPPAADGRTLCSVITDHEHGLRLAARHLTGLGHRRIAFVTHGRSQTGERLLRGWSAVREQSGLEGPTSPAIVESGFLGWSTSSVEDEPADLGHWPAPTVVDRVLDEMVAVGATAVIAHSDHIALPLVHHARRRGWGVPDALSVVAYDDEVSRLSDPPLTAVAPPKAWVGYEAAELLLELLEAARRPTGLAAFDAVPGPVVGPPRRVVASPSLVLRESTAPIDR